MCPRAWLGVIALFLWAATSSANEDRIWVDAKINGKPVRLIVDTGAFDSILLPEAAKALGVKVFPPLDASTKGFSVRLGETEPFDLTILNFTGRTVFGTYDFAAAGVRIGGDGVYGWKHMRTNIWGIDAAAFTVKLLDRVPEEAAGWTKLPIAADDTLSLEMPGEFWTIAVDTGSPAGISLSSKQWRQWKASHTNAPVTLDYSHTPSGGLTVREEAWAKEISIGSLQLADVPIRQPNLREVAEAEVVFGLAALARVDCIVDGQQGWAYLRPRSTLPAPYQHSRIGAVFAPRHSRSEEMVAHVVEGGPAHEAGIRNGDILLKIGDSGVKRGRVENRALYEFWESPAGTKLELTVKRGDQRLKMQVVLRDILTP